MLYFAYGSNLNHFQMRKRCKDSKFLKILDLKGFRLTFRSIYRVADIEPKKNSFVPGALFEISKSDEKKYFRIAVQGGGCSGFKYNFSIDDRIEKDDILFNKAIVDKQSLDIIAGSTVDFKKEMIGESFSINNPKASASCGCGLSFSV